MTDAASPDPRPLHDPADLVARYHAAINALDFVTIEAFLAENATYLSGKIGELKGRKQIMDAFRTYFAEYPDQRAEDSLIETLSPRSVRSVWQLAATSIITGNRLERRGEEIATFNDEGRIVRVEVTDH